MSKSGLIESELRRIMGLSYTRELRQNGDGSWFARVVELPGCMSEGSTRSEALDNLDDAMRAWIAVQLEDGDVIPEPISEARYSGKLVVRMSSSLHRALSDRASREGVSLNSFICTALAREVGNANTFLGLSFMLTPQLANADSSNLAGMWPEEIGIDLLEVSAAYQGSDVLNSYRSGKIDQLSSVLSSSDFTKQR